MLRRIWQYIVPLRVCMFDINTTIKDQCITTSVVPNEVLAYHKAFSTRVDELRAACGRAAGTVTRKESEAHYDHNTR